MSTPTNEKITAENKDEQVVSDAAVTQLEPKEQLEEEKELLKEAEIQVSPTITPENTPIVKTPSLDTQPTSAEHAPSAPPAPAPVDNTTQLPEKVRILKEAFPETDVDIIEAILQATGDNVEGAFEALLGMSDPNYTQPPQEEAPPPMPPRPNSSVEDQMRLDEEFAKKLAMEDEVRAGRRRSSQQQQRPSQDNMDDDDDDPFQKFQEELPIIKEKMKEAGNAAKKKVMDLYNQFKANTQKNTNQNQYDHMSTLPTTNAQYRGLPGDDGDDLLTGDNTALHLSDYDVYAQTNERHRLSSEYTRDNDTIYVNPPPMHKVQTSTSDAQLRADEDFARRLAEEEQQEARRSRHSEDNTQRQPPQMPPRKSVNPTVVIAPRSPLEFAGDSDYEDVGLTASSINKNNDTTQRESLPYVIGDDDDSDSDLDLSDLVDDDDDEEPVNADKKTADQVEKVDDIKKEDDEKEDIKKDDIKKDDVKTEDDKKEDIIESSEPEKPNTH